MKVMFVCNHCPFVIHLKEDLVKFANEYIPVRGFVGQLLSF